MIKLKEFNGVDVELYIDEFIDMKLALKFDTIFGIIEGHVYAITNKETLGNSLSFISKLSQQYELVYFNEDDFLKLKHTVLEYRRDDINESKVLDIEDDDDDILDILEASSDILEDENLSPIIKFVNKLFYEANKQGASDIHIETHKNYGEVRFRINGVLSKYLELNKKITSLVISRIKVISNLNIAQKRIPQDGRFSLNIAKSSIDIRVSLLPTYYGERVVSRLLMNTNHIPKLDELGFDRDVVEKLENLTKIPHGIILVTGPTGSGKSTTLHSFLQMVEDPKKNIITIEDPVEYNADNINQIQVNNDVGLDFALGLRTMLRQDPDIIMVGEIRDKETASIASRAALTGHLVLSTLHTNSAIGAIARLEDMEVEKFLIASSLVAVLAQRLVRKLCFCKEKEDAYFKAKGCKECNFTGYTSRIAVGEMFVVDKNIKNIIKHDNYEEKIYEYIHKNGFQNLQFKLNNMLKNGDTSLDEVVRVGGVS